MTPDEVKDLVARGESETLEFKATTAERETVSQTVCAMLNNRGGLILIGITPLGEVTGQQVGEQTIERVCQEFQNIDPPAFPSIDRIQVGLGREVLLVRVNRGDMKPYRYRGNAHVRVGNTNRRMSRSDEDRMFLERVHGERRWENQPAEGWEIGDLDHDELYRAVNAAIQSGRLTDPGTREPEELVRGLSLLKDGALLRAAVVLFGQSRKVEAELSQCLLRVARFQGVDRASLLDNRQFRGNAFELLSHAERFLRDNLPIAGQFSPVSLLREDRPLYPLLALREALANAFCHRDYSSGGGSVSLGIYDDRLEITSTGSLHFGLTPEMLFLAHESQPWNPLIANVFYRRGIIEQWGRGIAQMVDLATSAGLPKPEIEDVSGNVTVRFRPSSYVPPQRVGHNLTERQRTILLLLDQAPAGLALNQVLARLEGNVGFRQVQLDLNTLRTLELVKSSGRGRGARWSRR